MPKKYPLLSELNDDQKGHLAWILDHKTHYGMLTAMHCARGDWGDMLVTKALEDADMTPHQAKVYATRVLNYKRPQPTFTLEDMAKSFHEGANLAPIEVGRYGELFDKFLKRQFNIDLTK